MLRELETIKGIGAALAKKFALLGVHDVQDLVEYFPRRYEDYSHITSLERLQPGPVTIQATIDSAKGRYVRRGMHITEAVATDSANRKVRLVWFNQPYRAAAIKPDQSYFISGTYELTHNRFAIMSPSIELVSDFPVNTARIIPVYRETKGLTSVQIRKAVREILSTQDAVPETLPPWLIAEQQLIVATKPYIPCIFQRTPSS